MFKSMRSKFWWLLSLLTIIAWFFIYFKPFSSQVPLPKINSKTFFNQTYPHNLLYSRRLRSGKSPFWNPYNASGISPLSDPGNNVLNPINLVLLKILPFSLGLKLIYLVSSSLLFGGSYLFFNSIAKKPWLGFIAAFLFSFSGPMTSQVSNLPKFQAFSCLPIIFYLSGLLFKKIDLKKAILLGFFLGLQFLSGPIGISFLTLFLLLTQILFYRIKLKKMIRLTWILTTYFLISFPKLLYLFRFNSFPKYSLETVFKLSPNFNKLKYFWLLSGQTHLVFYTGISVWFLALLSLAIKVLGKTKKLRLKSQFFYFFSAALFSFFMIFVKSSPLYFLYFLPLFSQISSPVTLVVYFSWFITCLSVLGIKQIVENNCPRSKFVFLLVVLFAIVEILRLNLTNLPSLSVEQRIKEIEKKYPFLESLDQAKTWSLYHNVEKILPLEPDNNLIWETKSLNSVQEISDKNLAYLRFVFGDIKKKDNKHIVVGEEALGLLTLQRVEYLVTNLETNLNPLFKDEEIAVYKIDQNKHTLLNQDLQEVFSGSLNESLLGPLR